MVFKKNFSTDAGEKWSFLAGIWRSMQLETPTSPNRVQAEESRVKGGVQIVRQGQMNAATAFSHWGMAKGLASRVKASFGSGFHRGPAMGSGEQQE